MNVTGKLVYLVEQKYGIRRTRVSQTVNDSARHRADIGAPVPADFRLVAHAAEAHAHEFSAERARHRLGDGRFAHARRPDKTKDRPLDLFGQLQNRKVFDDTFLYALQPEMIGVEHRLCRAQIFRILRIRIERKFLDPVEIVENDGIIGTGRIDFIEPRQLFKGFFLRFGGQVFILDLIIQRLFFVLVVAELGMNGFQLFAQIKFLLPLIDVLAHLRADFALDFGNFQLLAQKPRKTFQTLYGNALFQKFLALALFKSEYGKHVVDELVGIGHFRKFNEHVLGHLLIEKRIFQHRLPSKAEISFRFRSVFADIIFAERFGNKHAVFRYDIFGKGAVKRFRAHLDVAARQLDDLRHARDHAVTVQIVFRRRIDERVFLRGDKDLRSVFRRGVDRREGDLSAHVKTDKGFGKNHLAAQGDHGQALLFLSGKRVFFLRAAVYFIHFVLFHIFTSSPLFALKNYRQYFFSITSTGFCSNGTVTSSAAARSSSLPSPTATP